MIFPTIRSAVKMANQIGRQTFNSEEKEVWKV